MSVGPDIDPELCPLEIAIWGASGHALVVADAARLLGYRVVAFIDSVNLDRHGTAFGGARVLGGSEVLAQLRSSGVQQLIVAIGDCAARQACAQEALSHGFRLARIIHPGSVLAESAVIGPGSFVAAAAVVGPSVEVGENVILNTSSVVDHECLIGDGVHVGPGVRLAGRVHVGSGTWLGLGCLVIDGVQIGEGSILGAGALLLKDLPSGVVAFGVPAKVVRAARNMPT